MLRLPGLSARRGSLGDEFDSGLFGYDPKGGNLDRSRRELRGSLGDEFALVSRAVEFELARLTLALGARDCCGPIRRATDDFLERHLSGMAVGQTYNDHAEVHEVRIIEKRVASLPPC